MQAAPLFTEGRLDQAAVGTLPVQIETDKLLIFCEQEGPGAGEGPAVHPFPEAIVDCGLGAALSGPRGPLGPGAQQPDHPGEEGAVRDPRAARLLAGVVHGQQGDRRAQRTASTRQMVGSSLVTTGSAGTAAREVICSSLSRETGPKGRSGSRPSCYFTITPLSSSFR